MCQTLARKLSFVYIFILPLINLSYVQFLIDFFFIIFFAVLLVLFNGNNQYNFPSPSWIKEM